MKFVATFAASIFAGAALYINLVEHPARLALDTKSAALEWIPSYARATWMQAPLALLSLFTGLACWLLGAGVGWAIAALCIGAVVPFTFLGIMPTNKVLLALAAFAPDAGQSAGDLNGSVAPTPGAKEFRPDPNGYLRLTDKGIAEDFPQDLSASEKKLMAATQGQTSGPNELGAKVSAAAWKAKPTYYIVAYQDRMILPDLEKTMAQRMHAKTIHIASSHVPMLSHPTEVAEFIAEAAGSK